MEKPYHIIESQSRLDSFAKALSDEKSIAVDLEADSMYHFSEKVCLIQISTRESTFIIDPLQDLDLTCLKPVFGDPGIVKIFHGSDYDIRSLYRDFSLEINPLFDTHVACRFLGHKETSLEAVLNNFFDITLNKRFQKKDWSQRPLPEEMIDYAASDSHYLLPLAKMLKKDLKDLDRLYWVEEECALLSQVRPAQANNAPLYLSFKGAGTLAPKDLAVLEAILQLRKTIARQKDRPLFKIFQTTAILKLVKHKPTSEKHLKKTEALSSSQMEMYGQMIIDAIEAALQIQKPDWPFYPKKRHRPLKGIVQQRIKLLREWKDKKGVALNIDPALVLNKAIITAIAEANPEEIKDLSKIDILKKWQIREFGGEIIGILKGL